MFEYFNILLHDTIALITILNPIAAASIMLGLLYPANPATIKPVALKATLTVVIASLVTLYSGEFIFKFFGISVDSIKIIGGIVLLLLAMGMIQGEVSKNRHSKDENAEAQEKEDISVIPLGIPILFGPGVIATIVVLQHSLNKSFPPIQSYLIETVAILLASLFVYITLRYANALNKLLGVTGMKILTRVMGLIVGAIASQFLVSGVKTLWNSAS